ncbi:MAG: DUF2272 domain-containing protein [Burkholderiales bacterium]|nr:DUF2272 domain-containing protein [Burkholderiales bacterium]
MRILTLSLLALAIAGCAAPGRPPLTPSPDVTPNFVVPDARSRMVYLAEEEWTLFGRPVVVESGAGEPVLGFGDGNATNEVQGPMLARVLMYWYRVTRQPIVGHQGELQPWSAAFIAWLARSAGLTPAEFPSTVLHWDYIERFLSAGDRDRFAARDPARYAPRVGDLVCNARNSDEAPDFADAGGGFPHLRRGPYHCDLVVAARAGEIEVIGGNVRDVVALTRLGVDVRGVLVPHPRRRWAAVLEQRDVE